MNRLGQRLERLRQAMAGEKLDSLLITHLPNIYYLTGFSGTAGVLAVSHADALLCTDGRYRLQVRDELRGVAWRITPDAIQAAATWLGRKKGSGRVGFEASRLPYAVALTLQKPRDKLRWIPGQNWVETLRETKDQGELAAMRRAARLVSRVFREVVPIIRPGVREDEVAAEIDYRIKRAGGQVAFPTIVASGRRSAYPHGRASRKVIGKNELVVLDLGAILGHYCSDLTRTVYTGKASRRIQKWHQAILEAESAACWHALPGKAAQEVDAAARRVLRKSGLDRHFVHGTGHGLGLEVHEAPRIAKGQQSRLRPNMVITIEPGVYVEGFGGIRVEDDLVITQSGNEFLTDAPRVLQEL